MKRAKLILTLIFILFCVLVFFQNKAYFTLQQSFIINLGLTEFITPAVYTGVLILACFAFGFLIAYISGLAERFRCGKVIKELTAKVEAQLETISELKNEVDTIRGGEETVVTPEVIDLPE